MKESTTPADSESEVIMVIAAAIITAALITTCSVAVLRRWTRSRG